MARSAALAAPFSRIQPLHRLVIAALILNAASAALSAPRPAAGSVATSSPAFFRPLETRQSTTAPPTSLKPLLLYLPGIDGTGRSGGSQWPRLQSDFDIWCLRTPPEDRSSYEELLGWVEAFVGEQGEQAEAGKRRVLILAESAGAVLALGLALRRPHLIDSLCLINPATSWRGDAPEAKLAELLPSLPQFVYDAAPGLVTPAFGKPGWFSPLIGQPFPAGLPTPAGILAAGIGLAGVLPPEALRVRLQNLADGADFVRRELAAASPSALPWRERTLLLAGGRDLLLPSVAETQRLVEALPGAKRKVLPFAAHAALDDTRELNLRLELEIAGILPALTARAEATRAASASGPTRSRAAVGKQRLVDPSPRSAFEGWLTQMRRLFSPVFLSTQGDGSIRTGLDALDPLPAGPLLFVGNHQLYGFDGPMIVEELLRERGLLLRALVYPPLLADASPLAPFPYPLPGTKETFERFNAMPVSARALFKALSDGEAVLLFPGGAREVFKRKREEYQLFWPDEPDLVRVAARLNASIVPFSGIGGDESFAMALDSQELLDAPAVGRFFRERVEPLPSFVKDDVFIPPFGAITPARHYFLFGRPISTAAIDATDRTACASVYSEVQRSILRGIGTLQTQVRDNDPYRDLAARTAWEAIYGVQAPSVRSDEGAAGAE